MRPLLPLLLLPGLAAAPEAAPPLVQKPALNATHIVFVHAGDLWSVPRQGGEAVRLTTGPGVETNPVFSPDGARIAFTGEYDGNIDVFVMPASGGIPKRLTWHPSPDTVLGWTPDGKRILFASPRESYTFFSELFTVGLDGGFPEKLPLPMGWEGAYSPDGSRLAYVPIGRAFAVWKRYRGGRTTPIWIATLAGSRIEKVPRDNSNDFNPLWIGDKVYFLSDRAGAVALYSYDTRTRQVKQELANSGLDLRAAAAGPGAIVYEQFGGLHLFDLKSGRTRPVPVRVNGDMPDLRDRLVNVGRRLRNAHLSPSAARAVFEARGEILTVPAEKGDVRNLTTTAAVAERDPAWAPDGKAIAFFSDEAGEYALHLAPQTGMGSVTKIPLPEPGFYRAPQWSPDSRKIAFLDNRPRIWWLDVETKKAVQVDKEPYWTFGGEHAPVWSPDSRWLAYARRLQNYMFAIHLYSVADGKSTQVTDGMSDARHPVFDRDGKHLYFTASTDSGPSLQPDIGGFFRPTTRSVYLAVLAKDQPSPLAPESDEEKESGARSQESGEKKEPAKAEPVAVKIDLESIGQRILALPLPPRRYVGLQAGKEGVLYALEMPLPAPGQPAAMTVHRYHLKPRKSDTAVSGVSAFEVARNGEKMLYRQGENWFIKAVPPPPATGAAPPSPPTPALGAPSGQLRTSDIEVRISPRDEWRQMYREAWRFQRDFFYDPNYHGLDLKATEKKYEPYVASVASRGDLNYLFAEMMGQFVIGHLGVGGSELPEVKRVQTGLLGCDFRIENGRYRFARVYSGENWNPEARAPLTQPGVNVVAGEYLLAVNGRNLTAADNVYSFFEGLANKNTVLRVGPNPTGANSREVTVVPVPSESRLRNLAWIEDNRRKVDQATGGRVAYVYMPDTSFGGFTNFNRYFFAQVGKEAAIIDERFNGGGMLATDIVEQLTRKLMSKVATRDGEDEVQPQRAIFGPKAMIISEFAGSGGDAMPWYFKRAGAGPLIGKRTWGGLVGRAAAPDLMDGGFISSPSSAVWNPHTSQWEVENIGIAPDIEVEHDPELVRQGRDPQLEKAIEVVMAALAKSPLPKAKRPAYPNYYPGSTAGQGAFAP
ncbi:MAG: PDZ domain-containing protein [Acidobacteriota bacterium]